MSKIHFYLLITFLSLVTNLKAQELSNSKIKSLIEEYKKDRRGPYSGIKWYCKDDTERVAKDPCPDSIGGGIQHASFKPSALKLRETNTLFFGEILSAVKPKAFLDESHHFSRLKQYQIGKYLASVDEGWILQKAQYYRGAFQSEDEQQWGVDFFETLLKNDNFIDRNYFLIRQALKDIPHNGDDNIAQSMRSESKIISEELPSFMDLRIKIHGQPEASDITLVENYRRKNTSKLSDKNKADLTNLLKTMRTFHAPTNFVSISNEMLSVSEKNKLTKEIIRFLENSSKNKSAEDLITDLSNILYNIRLQINSYSNSKNKLKVLDISNQLELILIKEAQKWKTETLEEIFNKIQTLACASMSTGLIEVWEFSEIDSQLAEIITTAPFTIKDLNSLLKNSRSVVEWSSSMVKANYNEVVNQYTKFEPLSYGFIDDRLRSSIALNLGETVSDLGTFVAKTSKISNNVMQLDGQASIRGLNPGFALGELVVVDGNPDAVEVINSKIYIFEKPPSDLKPVAGIMSVSEGNLVSHVQLLARNLGVPNAVLSYDNLKALKQYNGERMFYAVSNDGNVILKREEDMNSTEKELFKIKKQSKNTITVPTHQIRLDKDTVVNLRKVGAEDSGKLCGPKAANLGELKLLFPNDVVEGLIIPFGVFRSHMNQEMPGQRMTYWAYLNTAFEHAKVLKSKNENSAKIESFLLSKLKTLHNAIIGMPLSTKFKNDLYANFKTTFGKKIGDIPVFLRSDTNMEDLKEFTGAGLNLTLFNIKEEQEIINGIKRVWASAYTERSFKWRQQYLSNPENVFPSILIIPSVDVDYSGVMITKGINSGNENDLTVAFSRGAGGAVDGQSAETRLITPSSNILLAPSREPDFIRLPELGGVKKYFTSFEQPILNESNVNDIKKLADLVRLKIHQDVNAPKQVYDVEFGFKDNKLWLFQIRPFVENNQARSSEYLKSIAPKIKSTQTVLLTTPLKS